MKVLMKMITETGILTRSKKELAQEWPLVKERIGEGLRPWIKEFFFVIARDNQSRKSGIEMDSYGLEILFVQKFFTLFDRGKSMSIMKMSGEITFHSIMNNLIPTISVEKTIDERIIKWMKTNLL